MSDEKPKLSELLDDEKTNLLIQKIKDSKLKKTEKDFLINAAYRHLKFDYAKIADYYAHSSKEVQELMEESALVIIDFEKAISHGYVTLCDSIKKSYPLPLYPSDVSNLFTILISVTEATPSTNDISYPKSLNTIG